MVLAFKILLFIIIFVSFIFVASPDGRDEDKENFTAICIAGIVANAVLLLLL